MTTSIIKRVLPRTTERDAAGQLGRPKDRHKEMQRVAAIFGTEIDDAMKPFQVQENDNKAMGVTIHEALQHQKISAEPTREQQLAEVPQEPNEAHAQAQILSEEAAELLQSIPANLAAEGPVAFAHLTKTSERQWRS